MQGNAARMDSNKHEHNGASKSKRAFYRHASLGPLSLCAVRPARELSRDRDTSSPCCYDSASGLSQRHRVTGKNAGQGPDRGRRLALVHHPQRGQQLVPQPLRRRQVTSKLKCSLVQAAAAEQSLALPLCWTAAAGRQAGVRAMHAGTEAPSTLTLKPRNSPAPHGFEAGEIQASAG